MSLPISGFRRGRTISCISIWETFYQQNSIGDAPQMDWQLSIKRVQKNKV